MLKRSEDNVLAASANVDVVVSYRLLAAACQRSYHRSTTFINIYFLNLNVFFCHLKPNVNLQVFDYSNEGHSVKSGAFNVTRIVASQT